MIIFETFKDNKVNHYFFIKNQITKLYELKNSNFEYSVERQFLKNNPSLYIHKLDKKLDSLGIREYNGEPDNLGTVTALYMKDGKVIFKIDNIRRPNILQEAKKALCDSWYISPR